MGNFLWLLGKILFFTGIYLYNKIDPEGENKNYFVGPLIMQIFVLFILRLGPEGIFQVKKKVMNLVISTKINIKRSKVDYSKIISLIS
jgi:hypothetical protein